MRRSQQMGRDSKPHRDVNCFLSSRTPGMETFLFLACFGPHPLNRNAHKTTTLRPPPRRAESRKPRELGRNASNNKIKRFSMKCDFGGTEEINMYILRSRNE
ncbi:hypothetical protein TNIN_351201 [Trichonephila inaurata madagascariensis]|uniref:Uncharacterized protein n=1 Tax=Trichonephila inaurata madagascariensis TaxID=2747483 RepID=A0A8X6WRY2_9ARAC|nr:hypothetical protein TNIN_351201 [Trichonephila inaurata madagascariensis]